MIGRLRRRGATDDQAGLTVIELVLYTVLAGVVGVLVLSLVMNTLNGQNDVTSVTQASARGQAISQGLDRALRNAKGVNAYTDADGNQVLVVLTTLAVPCQAWRVTPTGKLQVSTAAGFTNWGELASSVQPVSTNPYFGWAGSRFRYSFAMRTQGKPVTFTGAIMPRGTIGAIGAACS